MYQHQLTFQEAVTRALKVNYCNFQDRASRSEYWWFALFNFLVNAVISGVFTVFFNEYVANVVTTVVGLALFLPSLGLMVRRLHDIGKSGWWVLLSFIPVVGWIIIIIWLCKESQPVPNSYCISY